MCECRVSICDGVFNSFNSYLVFTYDCKRGSRHSWILIRYEWTVSVFTRWWEGKGGHCRCWSEERVERVRRTWVEAGLRDCCKHRSKTNAVIVESPSHPHHILAFVLNRRMLPLTNKLRSWRCAARRDEGVCGAQTRFEILNKVWKTSAKLNQFFKPRLIFIYIATISCQIFKLIL